MKKKTFIILTIILVIALLGIGVLCFYLFALKDKKAEEKPIDMTSVLFTKEEFPRIDASLATQPLTDAIYSNFTGTDIKDVKLDYTNTHPGYVKLINGETDLIVVTEPSKEEQALAKEKGVELEVIPVVNEAFVFYVNSNNNVDSLTLNQIRDIYSGKITNWKELGGEDKQIIAYQRPVNSGSQTGMLSLVMNGVKMKEAKKTEYIESMIGIIDAVANYEDGPASIGYSYYYFATAMYGNDNIKLLKVNGVEPNFDNIRNKKYPIMTAYYIVVNKNKKDEKVQKLIDSMLSIRGQKVVSEAGYVPIK